MQVNISEKNEQPLMSRTELRGTISFEAQTPSRAEVRKKIAESVKADESLVMLTGIKTAYGQKSAGVTAHVYKTKEDVKKFASDVVTKRMEGRKKEGGEAPAPEAAPKKEAKPESKESPKKESKPESKESPKKESKPESKESPEKKPDAGSKEAPKKESKPEPKESPEKKPDAGSKEAPKKEAKPESKEAPKKEDGGKAAGEKK